MAVGDLIRWAGKWITEPPTHCHGHQLGPRQVLVGHTACSGHGGCGHTMWDCRTCEAITYGPALAKPCNVAIGPAAVRISSGPYYGEDVAEIPPIPF